MFFTATLTVTALILGVMLPLSVLFIRNAVKRRRQAIIEDLRAVFEGDQHGIISSFEFVKYKYFVTSDNAPEKPHDGDVLLYHWIFCVLPLCLVFTLLTVISLCVLLLSAMPAYAPSWGAAGEVIRAAADRAWAWSLLGAFVGGYLATMRELFRAITNFDLSPASFVSASLHLITGCAVAAILAAGWGHFIQPLAHVRAASVLAGFGIGFIPDLGLRTILRLTRLDYFKRADTSVYRAFRSTPLEIIDGIDTDISSRLSDYHLSSVQNLAASNPIMLFVETPYGVYQIMDWVAQAQLCSSVGTAGVRALWKLGVRTLFDLERIAQEPACRNHDLLGAVGHAMLSGAIQPGKPLGLSDDAILQNIRLRLDDAHVRRLRQIYLRIVERLGTASQRLPVTPPGCPGLNHDMCPLQTFRQAA